MKHILYFLLSCTVFSMAEITNGIVNADVTAGEFISQATTYETNGDYLNAAINYKKAGNEYAIQAIN